MNALASVRVRVADEDRLSSHSARKVKRPLHLPLAVGGSIVAQLAHREGAAPPPITLNQQRLGAEGFPNQRQIRGSEPAGRPMITPPHLLARMSYLW